MGLGYAGGSLLADYPLLAMIVGVALGSLVGLIIQRVQNWFFETRDIRRGVSEV